MYRHEGYLDKAEQLQNHNRKVFSDHGVEQILYFATGCGSQLEQGDFAAPVREAGGFIASLEQLARFRASIDYRVAIHKPCSLDSNRDWAMMLQLIKAIAGEHLVELPGNDSCCGSAGLHLLKYPQTARQLLEPKLQSLLEIAPKIVLTANTGCALHFYNGTKASALDIEVMHPAEWVSQLFLQENGNLD